MRKRAAVGDHQAAAARARRSVHIGQGERQMADQRERPADDIDAPPTERHRAVHLAMVDAVLAGAGLQLVAELAADAAGGPVAIILPKRAIAVCSPRPAAAKLARLSRYVADRLTEPPAQVPDDIAAEVPITAGGEAVGAVILIAGPKSRPSPDAAEYLHLAAIASLTEIAVEKAKEEVEHGLRGSFLEELRSGPDLDPAELVRRANRLGCDLSRGGGVLCAELTSDRPRQAVATIASEHPGALAEHIDDRVYALLPAARTLDRSLGRST